MKRKFIYLNLVYLSQTAAPTIGAARTIAETETKISRALKKRLSTNKVVWYSVPLCSTSDHWHESSLLQNWRPPLQYTFPPPTGPQWCPPLSYSGPKN